MPGILEFEMELSRKAIIAIAERKLARALTEDERASVQSINSLLQLDSFCRAFNSPACTSAEVIANLNCLIAQNANANPD